MTSQNTATAGRRELSSHRFSAILPMLPGVAAMNGEQLMEELKQCVQLSDLTVVAEVEAAFQPYGVSAIVILQESHVAAHCWPETNKMLVDVHICDYFSDNKQRAERLCSALGLRLGGDGSLERWHYARIEEKPAAEPVSRSD